MPNRRDDREASVQTSDSDSTVDEYEQEYSASDWRGDLPIITVPKYNEEDGAGCGGSLDDFPTIYEDVFHNQLDLSHSDISHLRPYLKELLKKGEEGEIEIPDVGRGALYYILERLDGKHWTLMEAQVDLYWVGVWTQWVIVEDPRDLYEFVRELKVME